MRKGANIIRYTVIFVFKYNSMFVILQLVYDFQKGEANFSLLSTFSEASDSDELNIQAFRELGFELPSQM